MSIESLEKKLQKQWDSREAQELAAKQKKDRQDLIDKSPNRTISDFYCTHCKKEFIAKANKEILTYTELLIAKYVTKHTCGNKCIRYITDKHLDPYWRLSPKLRRERQIHRIDMLQPGDPGYQTYYGNPYKKQEEHAQNIERLAHKKRTMIVK